MWGFLSAIFNKIASVAVTVLVAAGLVSAPLPPISEMPAIETGQKPVVEVEKPVLPIAAEIEKPKADGSETTKKLEEKLAQTAQLLEALKKASPPPAPTPVPAPSTSLGQAPSSAPSLPSGTFVTPSGTILDASGKVIGSVSGQSVTSSQSPQPATEVDYSQYANPPASTTLQLLKSAAVSIEFNSGLSCGELGFSSQQRNGYLCKLYKTQKNNYSWEIVESYTQDLSQYKQLSGTAGSSGPSIGSTVQLPRSVLAPIGLNPDIPCENLGLSGANLNLCKLYKEHKNDYTWNIVD